MREFSSRPPSRQSRRTNVSDLFLNTSPMISSAGVNERLMVFHSFRMIKLYQLRVQKSIISSRTGVASVVPFEDSHRTMSPWFVSNDFLLHWGEFIDDWRDRGIEIIGEVVCGSINRRNKILFSHRRNQWFLCDCREVLVLLDDSWWNWFWRVRVECQ